MRLFLGIDIPPLTKEKIDQYLQPLRLTTKGWENPLDYHQTLLFIGEASPEELDTISNKLNEFNFHPFELTFNGFHFFSRRIMYLGFRPSVDLMLLKKKIDQDFSNWVKSETKPFIPHITVKRWQRYEYDKLESGIKQKQLDPTSMIVKGLSLFKSEKDSFNQKYHILKTKLFEN